MKYALGNMLNGAGGLNPDGLALDLQFAADKTLTARKGPTPVLTRASTATFIGSDGLIQSAAINVARFDHDPVTLASRGLLIEESRTNLVFPSATLTTQTRTVTAVAHTLSFYGTGTVVLSGVAIATVTGTGAFPTRTTLTFTPTAGSLILTVTGTVTEAQLEAGAFPTSYIPTTTSALARAADVCSITGANFTGMYNQPEGTLFADARVETAARSANGFFTSLYNASSNEFSLRIFSNQVQITVRDGASKDFNVGGVATNMKVAAAYSSLNNVASLNNGAIATGTASNLPAMTGLSVGSRFASSTFCNGHLAAIRYYKKRLPNAKLQALTA